MIASWAGLDLGHPQIMGVLNLTPDSFSDGGKFVGRDAALAQAERMIAEGAAILDLGGESTRPGAVPVSSAEEQDRVLPIIEALADAPPLLSIDTRRAATARAAVAAGAHIWNDVTALQGDPASFQTALDLDLPLCLMHMQGDPQTMQASPAYEDVVAEVKAALLGQTRALTEAGLDPGLICLDLGIGFGKTLDHNLRILNHLDQFIDLPFAHLLGLSRKSYIDKAMRRAGHEGVEVDQRLPGSLASAVLAYAKGCRLFRVHDVRQTRQALEIAAQTLKAT